MNKYPSIFVIQVSSSKFHKRTTKTIYSLISQKFNTLIALKILSLLTWIYLREDITLNDRILQTPRILILILNRQMTQMIRSLLLILIFNRLFKEKVVLYLIQTQEFWGEELLTLMKKGEGKILNWVKHNCRGLEWWNLLKIMKEIPWCYLDLLQDRILKIHNHLIDQKQI